MQEEDDSNDEITVDFSRVTDFFKGKKKDKKETEKIEKKEFREQIKDDEEDVSIDFGKIKNFFKSGAKQEAKEKHLEEEEQSDENITFDFGAATNFLKKYGIFLLVLIPVFYSIAVRVPPATLSYTDDWAVSSVHNYYMSQIAAQINQQYPNLPQKNRDALVSEQFQKMLKEDKKNIDDQIKGTSQYFKSFFEDPDGKPYMPDIDPYYWYRYTKNILDHGYPGDIKKDLNGVQMNWDDHQIAPNGRAILIMDMFHPYFLAMLYKTIHFFNPSIDLMRSMFYYPVLVSALVVLIIYLIVRKLTGELGGFFAALMAGVNISFLGRTIFGHADSDAWVVFFPVIITLFFLEALSSKNRKMMVLFSALSGVFVGIFSLAWGGWWYIFDFIMMSLGLYALYYLILHRDELKSNPLNIIKKKELQNILIILVVFYIVSGIFIIPFTSLHQFLVIPVSSLGFTAIKAPVLNVPWPNVLTTVAELNEGSIDSIIANIGGLILLYIALLGIALSMIPEKLRGKDIMFILGSMVWFGIALWLRNQGLYFFFIMLSIPFIIRFLWSAIEKDTSINIKHAILLFIWFVGTFYASTKGIRFTLLLVPAFSIAFGIAVGKLLKNLSRTASQEFKIDKIIVSSVLIIISLMLIFVIPIPGSDKSSCPWYLGDGLGVQGMACTAYKAAKRDVPIINDAWYNSLKAIENNSSKNAIITSWWDFGHHFKALADRPVTFDGTTQDYPQAHWVGKSLLTGNEEEALGILRMLDCGGNTAYDELKKITKDSHKSIDVLYEIILMKKEDAKNTVTNKYKLSDEQADTVLKYTHCDPPEAFYITSSDMIGKSGVWAHFGSWNFERADIWYTTYGMNKQKAIDYMKQEHNYSDERAEQTYNDIQALSDDRAANNWIAGWPTYASSLESCRLDGNKTKCTNGLEVDLKTMDAAFTQTQAGTSYPVSIVYATKDGVFEKKLKGDVPYSVVLIPVGDGYSTLITSPELAYSMFTRLFFFEGHGLRHFKLMIYQKSITQDEIYVWKVDWKGSEQNVKAEFVEKNSVANKDTVEVYYIGYLENGSIFDSSIQNWRNLGITPKSSFSNFTNNPITFTVGENQVINGFEEAVVGMKLGEERVAVVPPEKAYGTDPKAHPLGNETLFFKIKVVSIK